jgi:hypothetical protein
MTPNWRPDVDVPFHDLDSAANLDPSRLALFREYLRQEYAGPFIRDMGSYEILQMARENIFPGRRLDIGSGTAALFWMLATDGGIQTTAADVEPEALFVLREFLTAPDSLPPCYYQAAALFGHSPEHVESLRRSIDSYLVFNAFMPWPPELAAAGYDSVTAFGCFAISGSEPSYRECFRRALLAVKSGGRLVGADWIRHPHLQKRDYSFVSVRHLRDIGEALRMRTLHLEGVAVRGHDTYSNVVLWAFERP